MGLYKTNQIEADNIKKIRTQNALSQEQLAEIIKEELSKNGSHAAIKKSTIQNYESGLYSIPLSVRKAIKDRFHVEIQEAPEPAPLKKIYKDRLKAARKKRGMDEETVSRLSMCPQYKRYETGKYLPKLEHHVMICQALKTRSDYLLGLKNSLPDDSNDTDNNVPQEAGDINHDRKRILKTFSENLKTTREINRLIPNSVAKITGCRDYPKYEKGESLPSLETLYKICKSLEVSSDYLIGTLEDRIKENQ